MQPGFCGADLPRAPAVMQSISQIEILPADRYPRVRELMRVALIHAASQSRWGKQAPDLACRDSLREVCNVARDQGLRAEQLLIVLKQSWSHLTQARVLDPLDSEGRLSSLVTGCIEEYYRLDSTD